MIFKKDTVTYSDIVMNDFIFIEKDIPKDFVDYIYGLDYKEDIEDDIKLKIVDANFEIKENIVNLLTQLDVDIDIKKSFNDFRYDINMMTLGESLPMHNEMRLISPFEICFWITKTNDFEGREFAIEKGNEKHLIKPYTGLFCFINTLMPDAYHGVTPLLTDTKIVTITGGLGNKFAYDKKHK
jgi:hypothetical protein